jgi:hypothetical protein
MMTQMRRRAVAAAAGAKHTRLRRSAAARLMTPCQVIKPNAAGRRRSSYLVRPRQCVVCMLPDDSGVGGFGDGQAAEEAGAGGAGHGCLDLGAAGLLVAVGCWRSCVEPTGKEEAWYALQLNNCEGARMRVTVAQRSATVGDEGGASGAARAACGARLP